jgi:hypothetical protein
MENCFSYLLLLLFYSVLECLDSVGQKFLFLAQETDTTELSSGNCQTIKCRSNKEVSGLLYLCKLHSEQRGM